MTNVSDVIPVTIIRERFTPSPHVQKALKDFTTGQVPDFSMFAMGFRVVDQYDYHHDKFTHEITAIEEQLRAIGSHALLLSGKTELITNRTGKARLLIEPQEPLRLYRLVRLLEGIPSLEPPRPSPHSLFYIEIAKQSLAKNIMELQNARDSFSALARHPSSRHTFTAGNPRIVGQDRMIAIN